MSASCLHYNVLYLKHIGIVLGSVLRENSRCLNREESYYEGAVKDLPHHILCGNSTFIKQKNKNKSALIIPPTLSWKLVDFKASGEIFKADFSFKVIQQ